MRPTIWHNPRCSKSRETLTLLREHGLEPEIRKYLEDPPDAATLAQVLDLLGLEPRDLMRRKEPLYAELALDDPTLTREALIDAMTRHPVLIERPVVLVGDRAALGRPPERVLAVLPPKD